MKKEYLTTPEEILALKDTDTKIYSKGSNGYYQFVQGVLCYFDDDGSTIMFCKMGIGKGYLRTYILVEEPVKEADKNDIGKLCKFRNDCSKPVFGILENIYSSNKYPYAIKGGMCFQHCCLATPAEVAEITGYKVEE